MIVGLEHRRDCRDSRPAANRGAGADQDLELLRDAQDAAGDDGDGEGDRKRDQRDRQRPQPGLDDLVQRQAEAQSDDRVLQHLPRGELDTWLVLVARLEKGSAEHTNQHAEDSTAKYWNQLAK